MPIDAFVLRYKDNQDTIHHKANQVDFAQQFLSSPDFDLDTLKRIVTILGKSTTGGSRADLVSFIMRRYSPLETDYERMSFCSKVMDELIMRKREWLSVKTGSVRRFPESESPWKLVLGRGEDCWYGPIIAKYNNASTYWYIRPIFVRHWEIDEYTNSAQELSIRWLCFARLTNETISLHWRGFSHADTQKDVIIEQNKTRNSQFPYWNFVPQLFQEIEELTGARVEYVNLHNLMLHQLWAKYIDNSDYSWKHRRIRAESGGVSLSAHAGGVVEVDFEKDEGILILASTIRKAIQAELESAFNIRLPSPQRFDDVILRTLIKELGSLSYEFILQRYSEQIFRAHSYFGLKENSNSPDRFPHMKVYISRRSDLEQLNFILEFLRSHPSHEIFETQPLPLF